MDRLPTPPKLSSGEPTTENLIPEEVYMSTGEVFSANSDPVGKGSTLRDRRGNGLVHLPERGLGRFYLEVGPVDGRHNDRIPRT